MVIAKNVFKSFGDVNVLKGIDLQVDDAEIVSIVGASGAGKTTLLKILGTLDRPDQGEVKINDKAIFTLKERELAAFRNRYIGFIFQFHHLLPEFTAFENICIPAYISGKPKKDIHQQADKLLDFLGVAHRKLHKPAELSGGEQQRIAVARALINNPEVILADEPSGNLDSQNKEELHKLFFTLRDTFRQTFIIVTHDESLANMSDRLITIHDGVIEQE